MNEIISDFNLSCLEKENSFVSYARKIKQQNKKLYIWGFGEGARRVSDYLSTAGIIHDGFVVNRLFFHHQNGVLCFEDLCDSALPKSLNFIISVSSFDHEIFSSRESKIESMIQGDCWSELYHIEGFRPITYQWCENNYSRLHEFYSMLCDELSRKTFLAFLNQKISKKMTYLKNVRQSEHYFDSNLVKLSPHEVFVDCGAYNGDSAVDFINALHKRSFQTYDEIVSFEPSPENFKELVERNLQHHRCIQKGVSDIPGTVLFSSDNTRGVCNDREQGGFRIETDTIDNVLAGGRATMIKMDIEGEELKALKGGTETIKKWVPVLAISIYHKPDDLITIPHFIKSLVANYKFFLRAYESMATEVVLYAIP